MANDLTGDYDVVAQFSLGAVNRLLAAMQPEQDPQIQLYDKRAGCHPEP